MRFDILALILSIVSACIAIVSLMSFVTYSSEVAALKIKIQKQDEKMEQWHIRMIERLESVLDHDEKVNKNAAEVHQLSAELIENSKNLIDEAKKQMEEIEELRSGCQKLLLLYSNGQEQEGDRFAEPVLNNSEKEEIA